jgi:formate dehydrogenase subunit gamma
MHPGLVSNGAPEPPATPAGQAAPDAVAVARAVVDAHRGDRGALLPILHGVQHALGHLPPEVVPVIAAELNLSRADVHGVVSFYKDFRRTPPGRCVVALCRAEACQAVGAEALAAGVQARLGVDAGGTRADGAVTLDDVYCLGNCALGPSVTVDGRLVGRATVDRVGALVDAALNHSAQVPA